MNEFLGFLGEVRGEVDAALDRLLPQAGDPPARLHRAMRYSVFAGGKRVRPALVLLTGELLGSPRARLLPGAAALEMIHTFSLVHDDLPALDDDDLRRGRPTVHREFDEPTAILAGDALLNLALEILASTPAELPVESRNRAVVLVAQAVGTGGMIGGQMADIEAEDHWPEDAPAALESIHRRKTGALLTASILLGAVCAGAAEGDRRTLEHLGEKLGLMFQVGDDILDLEGTSETLGKTAGKDREARKLTYPGLFGLAESKRLLADLRLQALELASQLPAQGGLFPALVEYLATRDR